MSRHRKYVSRCCHWLLAWALSSGGAWAAEGLVVNSSALDFGTVDVNMVSDYQVLTLVNASNASIVLNAVETSGQIDDFISAGSCLPQLVLTPGQLCAIVVFFYPTLTGQRSAQIIFRGSNQQVLTVPLSGQATLPTNADITPDELAFEPEFEVDTDTLIESIGVEVTGIDVPTPITVSGGEYSINGEPYTATAGYVIPGDYVSVRLRSATEYATTTSAVLTVGARQATFSATTFEATAVTDLTQLFGSALQGFSLDARGNVVISDAPDTPVQLRGDALANAIIDLPDQQGVPFEFDGHDYTFVDESGNAQLQVEDLLFENLPKRALTVSRGTADIRLPTSDTLLVLAQKDRNNGGALLTQTANTAVKVTRDGERDVNAYVSAGSAVYRRAQTVGYKRQVNRFAANDNVIVYAGETAQVSTEGELGALRIGSNQRRAGVPGDALSAVPFLSSKLTVPLLGGPGLPRLQNGTLESVAINGLKTALGLNVVSGSQDPQSGVLTLKLADGRQLRLLPLGDVKVDLTTTRNRFASVTIGAGGTYQLAAGGLQFSFAAALGSTTELKTALDAIDSGSTLSAIDGGLLLITLNNVSYCVQPGMEALGASSGGGIPGLASNAAGVPTFKDSTGATQALYPAFASIPVLLEAFRPDVGSDLTVVSNGNGTATASVAGKSFTLVPDMALVATPAGRRTQAWWADGGKYYVRYPDGRAQGFSIR